MLVEYSWAVWGGVMGDRGCQGVEKALGSNHPVFLSVSVFRVGGTSLLFTWAECVPTGNGGGELFPWVYMLTDSPRPAYHLSWTPVWAEPKQAGCGGVLFNP